MQITMHNVPRSPALEARIRAGAASLERQHPRLAICRVTVEEPEGHQHKGGQFGVRIEVRVPGTGDDISSMKRHEDVYVALRVALAAIRRQLEDVVRAARA